MTSVEFAQLGMEWARYGSLFDRITGLPNGWTLLIDRLEIALTRTRRTGLLAAVFVLEGPGLENDHNFGDVVARLRSHLRDDDTIGRIGDHRLAVVCSDIHDDVEAARLARGMLSDAGVQCTLGVALGGPRDTSDQLLARAIVAATQVLDSDEPAA